MSVLVTEGVKLVFGGSDKMSYNVALWEMQTSAELGSVSVSSTPYKIDTLLLLLYVPGLILKTDLSLQSPPPCTESSWSQ